MADGTQETQTQETETQNTDLEAARAALKAEKDAIAAREKTLEVHRQQLQQQMEQFQRTQQQQQQGYSGYGGYEQQEQEPDVVALKKQVEYLKSQTESFGVTQYKVDNPNWRDSWDRVQEIVNDQVRAQEVAVFDAHGNVDYNRSLKNAQREVELEDLRKAHAATQAAKEASQAEQDRQKRQATISGTTASEVEESVDVSGMNSDDMLEAGLVDFDPDDPIKPLHPKR